MTVPRSRAAGKPAGNRRGTPALKPSTPREREQVLQNCDANRRVWAFIERLRDIQNDLAAFVAEEVDDEAEAALRAAGLALPLQSQPFGAGTFNSVTGPFEKLAVLIAEELGLVGISDLPAPPTTPTTEARRAA
jgi:hypothetical protein